MRSGGCAVQQALTPEAAGVVKQAVVLAKRRGHSQVTPLHVANTMMGAGGGAASLFRAACLQSHSHPLQCKALELCFNVALNRLPAAASSCSPAAHHSSYPSISNALVAAFKRAQAHQRRGSENNNNNNNNQQQAALLTVKIELDQLIVSILDDPSVSRVMREAGFSSTQVKNNVEKAISPSSHASRNLQEENKLVVVLDPSSPTPPQNLDDDDDDLNTIIEALIRSKRNRNVVVVGESISKVEKTVEKLMERVEREAVPENLREVKFITFPPFYTFCNVRRELVQQKIQELAFLVRSVVGKGVVLYLGDLNWISEFRVSLERSRERSSYYCSVEHMIMEVGRLVSGFAEINGRLWLMGIATFQTYIKCRVNGYNSLQMLWRLHPITIPADTLGLSLVAHSNENGGERNEKEENGDDCPHDCSSRFEEEEKEEAQDLENGATLMSSLPPWLRSNYNHQNFDSFENRRLKSVERTLTLFTPSPSSSTSCFSIDQVSPNSLLPSNPSSTTNSPSSAEAVAAGQKFTEFNANNLNMLCNALEEKVPWQKEIIPEIAGTVLQCRSRMLRRQKGNHDPKEETWLFFLGPDIRGKEEIARNLAKFVFGSYSDFVYIGVERFARAVSDNPHRVFLVEGLEATDRSSWMRIKRAMEMGRVRSENGEEVGLFDGIVVLSSERLSYCFEEKMGNVEKVEDVSLDLNMCFGDDDIENMHDLGIIQNVDRVVVFKI